MPKNLWGKFSYTVVIINPSVWSLQRSYSNTNFIRYPQVRGHILLICTIGWLRESAISDLAVMKKRFKQCFSKFMPIPIRQWSKSNYDLIDLAIHTWAPVEIALVNPSSKSFRQFIQVLFKTVFLKRFWTCIPLWAL